MKKETWLITGGAGFIGSNLINYLLKKKQKIICLDNFIFSLSLKTLLEFTSPKYPLATSASVFGECMPIHIKVKLKRGLIGNFKPGSSFNL